MFVSRTPNSHNSMLVVVKSSGASVRRAPVREVANWLFGLDWCAWVSQTVCSVLPASASTVVASFPAHTLYSHFRGELI